MNQEDACEVWNRACMGEVGPRPGPGDQALADIHVAHGYIMNGGVVHALEGLEVQEMHDSIAGYAYYGLDEVVARLRELPSRHEIENFNEQEADELEEAGESFDEFYYESVDDLLSQRFEAVCAERPEDFAPVQARNPVTRWVMSLFEGVFKRART